MAFESCLVPFFICQIGFWPKKIGHSQLLIKKWLCLPLARQALRVLLVHTRRHHHDDRNQNKRANKRATQTAPQIRMAHTQPIISLRSHASGAWSDSATTERMVAWRGTCAGISFCAARNNPNACVLPPCCKAVCTASTSELGAQSAKIVSPSKWWSTRSSASERPSRVCACSRRTASSLRFCRRKANTSGTTEGFLASKASWAISSNDIGYYGHNLSPSACGLHHC